MEAQGVDMWITFTREGNEDPLVQDLRFSDLTWRSAAIIERTGTKTAIVGSLEEETVRQQKFYDEIIGYGSEGAAPKLREFVRKRKPKKIAVPQWSSATRLWPTWATMVPRSRTAILSSWTLASNMTVTVATSRETISSALDECRRGWSRCSRLLVLRMMLLSPR